MMVPLVLAVVGVIGYRVLAPTDMLSSAQTPYPITQAATSGISSELARTPLIVDDRLRVYAAKRQVWADTPLSARTETTPFWSLRRWPAQVVGVVTVGRSVVSKWSDGDLIAIDVRTGQVSWRIRSPVGSTAYGGRRTGAATVYTPPDLYTGRTPDGRDVVVSAGRYTVMAFDAASGAALWSVDASASCRTGGFTGPGFYATIDTCARPVPLLRRYELAGGGSLPDWRPPGAGPGWRIEPVGCLIGRSQCAAGRTFEGAGARQGWLFPAAVGELTAGKVEAGEIAESPALAPQTSWLAGERVVGGPPGSPLEVRELTAQPPRGGAPLWTWRAPPGSVDTSPVRIVAAEPEAIYLISEERTLIVLDPQTGLELARTPLERFGARPQEWVAGFVHARDRYVVVERLRNVPAPDPESQYLSFRPVLIAGA
jgi:hypothetical protein